MNGLLWLGLSAFLCSLVLTPVIRDVFRAFDIVDRPDGFRKTHAYAIPRVGGIAVAISYFAAYYWAAREPGFGPAQGSLVVMLLPAAMVIFVTGLIDDFLGLKPWQKLAGQVAAASMAYWAGVRIFSVAGHTAPNWASFLITVAWLLVCTNAFNLVDGLDGLAAGIGFFATLTIFTAAVLQHNTALMVATLPLAGCLLAFLCYNFNPATIFLGDGGSLLIGFLLGCFGAVWSNKSVTVLGMTAPLMALALPLLDVALAVLRRFLRSKPIFGADRGHIHHRLIDRGLSPRRVALIAYGLCSIAAAFSLLQTFTRQLYISLLVMLLFIAIAWLGIRYLQYSEFVLAGRLVRNKAFQRILDTQLTLERFSKALGDAGSAADCWQAIQQHYRSLGFCGVQLYLDGMTYREWAAGDANDFWTVKIPLSDVDFVELARDFRSTHTPAVISPLADLLRDALGERLHRAPCPAAARAASAS